MSNPYVGAKITGCNSPTIGNDRSTYAGVLDTAMSAIDNHDHTTGKGGQIPTAGIVDGAITAAKLATGAIDSAAKMADGVVAQSKLAARSTGTTVSAGGVAISASSGAFITSSATPIAVTNLSVTITTIGRPVVLMLVPDGSTTDVSQIQAISSGGSYAARFFILRDSAVIGIFGFDGIDASGSAPGIPPSSVQMIDPTTAAAHTYSVQVEASFPSNVSVNYVKLVAYEI